MIELISPVTYAWPARDQRRRMVAHLVAGVIQETDGSVPPRAALKNRVQRRDVAELVVLPHRVEPRQRVPDAGRLRLLRHGAQNIALSEQSGCVPLST